LLIYWIMFLILAGGALVNSVNPRERRSFVLIVFASVPTALMIGLRWKIGADFTAYQGIFEGTKLLSESQALSHADPGFYLFMTALHRASAPFWVENLICGAVFVFGLTAFCQRQPNPWLAYLAAFPYLVIVVGMSANRQSLALGFLFLALNAFEREQLWRFMLLVGIAALFHGSALLMAPLGLLSHTRNRLQQTLLLIVALVLGYYFFRETFATYARRYSLDRLQSSGVAYRLAMNAFAAVLFLAYRKRFAIEHHQDTFWRNISLTSLALIGLAFVVPSSTSVDRFLLYLFPLQSFVFGRLPSALGSAGKAAGQITLAVIAYAAAVQVTFLEFGRFSTVYVPYKTIFNRNAA
jgi:hypothetical protein